MRTIKSGLYGLILLVVASSALFLTCNVGLGDSVDTKPPTVTITYPPVQSIIKNSFTMSGAASDDTSLASVSVGVVNTVTAATYGPYAATIDATTSAWSLVVNNYNDSGYELRDGTYEMTVTAVDGAGRKTVATTTYEIDNTPPVVVIDRPGSCGPISETNPGETYGTELKVTGSINDDHAIDKLVFTAYDPSGNVVGTPITQTNISGVAMDITLAKFFSSPANADEVALNNLYNTIYTGYDSATGKYNTLDFYCTITASDSAREFNPPAARASADNSRGNVNSSYYLYDDIYSQVFAATGFAVTMKDLTAMFNGSYADTAKAQAVLAVLGTKSHPAATWSTGSASFSLNPTNSPSYEVKGFTSISAANPIDGMKKTNGTDLTIIVKAGRDGVPLLPDTFKVYLDPCGSSGSNPTETAGVDDLVLLDTVAALGEGSSGAIARNAKITKSGTDYSIFVNIGSIATKTNYRLHVTGSDQNGKTLEEQNYGFRVITNGKPPAITIGSTLPGDYPDPTPLNVSTINNLSVTCIGYVTCETGLKTLPATITVINTTTNALVKAYTVDLSSQVGPALAATKWTLPIDTGADTSDKGLYQYTVSLTATDEEGNSTAATRIFYIDREPPKVEFNTPDPVVDVKGTNKVNGIITYSGRITDNYGVDSAEYSLDGGSTFIKIVNPLSWTIKNIDTRNYDNDPGNDNGVSPGTGIGTGTLKLMVSMVDKAQNHAIGTTYIDIDQSTDKPVITLTNANVGGVIIDPTKVDKDHNLFGTITNNTIYGTVKDDDKLKTVTVKIDTDKKVDVIDVHSAGSTYALNYVLSGAAVSEGIHTIEFIATDENDVQNTTGVFRIGIDEAPPTLEITSPAQGAYCNGKLTVKGKVKDGSGVVTLVGTEDTKTGSVNTSPTVNADGTWQDEIDVSSKTTGSFKQNYTATDKYLRTTSVVLDYGIDTTPPEITVSTPKDTDPADGIPDEVYVQSENVFQIVGAASDVGSAVAEVRYKVLPATDNAPSKPADDWPVAVNTTNWTANLNLSDSATYPNNVYKVYLAAKDSAGNYSAITVAPTVDHPKASTVTLFVDRKDPVLTVLTSPKDPVRGDIVINGTAIDPDGNLNAATSVTYVRTALNNSKNSQGSTSLPLSGDTWAISDSGRDGDTYTYTITATDKAGRKVTSSAITVIKDITSPSIEISSITKQLVKGTDSNVVNGIITVKGTITDNDQVASGTYTVKIGAGTDSSTFTAKTSPVTVTESGTLRSWSFTVDTTKFDDNKDLAVTVVATDRAGNNATKDSGIVHIDQSTDKPVITLSNALVSVNTDSGVNATTNLFGTTSNNKLLGTITDDDELNSSVTVMIDGMAAKPMTVSSSGTVEYTFMKADNSLLEEKKHEVEIIASDKSGVTKTSGKFWIGIDAGDPSIAVTSPAQGEYYSGTKTISGTAKDGSGIAKVVRVGGDSTNLYNAGIGLWSDSFNVGTETKTDAKVTYEATDIYGRTKTADFTYNVDGTPPTLSEISPAAPTYIKAENVYQVTGKAADDSGTVSAVIYKIVRSTTPDPKDTPEPTIDSSWITAVNTNVWTANVDLSTQDEGDYLVFIASKDRADNHSTVARVTLHADKKPPVLTPKGASVIYTNKDETIAYTVTDTYLDTVTYTRVAASGAASGSGSLTNAAGEWSIKDENLPADTYTYTVTAKDKAGHEATNTVQLVKDVSLPTIEINSITKQLTANGRSDNVNGKITVKGTITDNDKVATGTYTLSIGGTNVTGFVKKSVDQINDPPKLLMNWSFDIDTTASGITDGKDLAITINATDRAGNGTTSTPQTVHVDQSTDKPVVTMSVPAYVGKNYVVTGTVTDDDGVEPSKLTINYNKGTTWLATPVVITDTAGTPTNMTFSYKLPDLGDDGLKQVTVSACDTEASNDAITAEPILSGPVSFTVDTHDPVITITDPAVNDTSASSGITIKGSVDEIGLKSLTVSIDGNTPEVLKNNDGGKVDFTYSHPSFASLAEGRHTATFEAVPQYGKTVTAQRTFFKDTTGPTITFSNLTASASPATAILTPDTIRGMVSDSGSSVKTSFRYRFDTDEIGKWRAGTDSGSTWSVSIPDDLSETNETDPLKGPATHTIIVEFKDILENPTTSSEMQFRLDRKPPTITFTPPVKTVYSADFKLKCSSSDANGIEKTVYYVDDTLIAPVDNDTDFLIDTSKQVSGNHTVKIVATDKVGRTEQAVFSYTFDNTPPVVTITGITPIADTKTVKDPVSGKDIVQVSVNGTVTISASATDDNGIDGYAYAITLPGVTDGATIADTAWKSFSASSVTASFDSTAVSGGEDTLRRIWVRTTDKAGNSGYAPVDRFIDQDSDKPIVTLTNLATTGSPTLVSTKVIYGTISDDDGSVTSLQMKNLSSGSWTVVPLNGQSFTYTVTGPDGANQLYFQIVDSVGTTFTTDTPSSATPPRLYQAANTYLETPLSFNLDTTPPDIGSDSIGIKASGNAVYSAFSSTNAYFSGSASGLFMVQFMASSANTVASATVTITDSVSKTKTVNATPSAPVSVTVDVDANTLSSSGAHGLIEGTRVFFSGTTLPGGLTANVPYYVITTGLPTTDFKVSATPGGSAIDISSTGSAVNFTTGWTTDEIDISKLANGAATLSISTADVHGLSSTMQKMIMIDNVKPNISVTSHKMNDQVTGDVVFNGTSDDGTGSGVTVVEYHVGKCADLNTATWNPMDTQLSWTVNFTSAANNVITTAAKYANATYADNVGANVWKLPIYLRAIDKAGNVQDYTFYLNVDPDGDKPTASISYPATGTTLGGNIRIFGSAKDNVSVSSVWMEIDTNNDGKYDTTDISALKAHGYSTDDDTVLDPELYKGFKLDGTASWSKTINGSQEFNAPDTVILATAITSGIRYKIVTVDGTNYMALGATSNDIGAEFTANANGTSSTGTGTVSALTNLIQVRVRACDDKLTYGTWSNFNTIKIDNKAPTIGSTVPLKLVQYTDGTLTTVAAEQSYVSDMYIRGEWYLVGSVDDESGIKAISVSGSSGNGTIDTQPSWFVQTTAVGSYHNYTFRIPVGKATTDTSCGAQAYTVYVEDASDPTGTTTQTITLNYDNKAPVLATLTHGGTPVSSSNLVVQSNNTYTFSSTVTEDSKSDSGFNRLVFFFVRQKSDGTNKRVYNPMLSIDSTQTAGDVTGNRTYLSNLTWDAGDVPRLAITGATRSGEDSLTHPSIQGNQNVRVGGLVRIAGVDRLIKSVDRTAGTITFSPSVSTSYTAASLLYGLVVDNTVVEVGVWSGSTLKITNDDGDGMVESVVKSGGTWTWDASVDSKNIPDGPISLCYVAYDKAGNTVSGSVQSSVANSGPRIAKIQLGTDLSGDGAFSSSEVSTVYTATSGSEPTRVDLTDQTFKMKGDLAVIPEFVGGNGTLKYVWTADTSGATAWNGTYRTTKATTSEGTLTSLPGVTVSSTSYANGIKLSATDTGIIAMSGALKLFSFTVWDQTDETTQGTDSQWALINVPVHVAVVDSVPPVSVIKPFYWNGSSSNSLYGNSSDNGHIELSPITGATSGGTGLLDYDPKVSGKIKVEGTAFDDQLIKRVYARIDGLTYSSTVNAASGNPTFTATTAPGLSAGDIVYFAATAGNIVKDTPYYVLSPSGLTFTLATTFNGTTAITPSAVINTANVSVYRMMASYSGSTWTPVSDTIAGSGRVFSVSDVSLNQDGHSIAWTLGWDTAKIASVTGTDKIIRVMTMDRNGNLSSLAAKATGVTATNNVPAYQVDVVPYIKGVKTSLSTLKKTNSSVYDRTALGHYPVRSDLNAYFYGFNLAANATVTDSAATTITLGSADSSTYSGYTVYPAAVSTLKSGPVSITVNSVVSVNNLNSNDAKGSYTDTTSSATGDYGVYSNYYNRQPNNDNNNTLTDDVVLDVWKVKNSARSHSGTLTEPIMRIVPTASDTASDTDVMRFAFTNGADYFSMASATDKVSYQDWQRNYADFNNVAFTYDKEGNSYGITTGLDTYPDTTHTFAGRLTFISSRWGICNTGSRDDNYYGLNKLRLEAIGIMQGAYVQGSALTDVDYIMDTRRFSSPVLATAVHGGTGINASTSVYLAYYDKFQKQIRFRYGTFDKNTTVPTQTGLDANNGFGQFQDQHGQADVNNTGGAYYHNNKYAFDSALSDYSLIAGIDAKTKADTGNTAGKYVAIDVYPDASDATKDVVVAVWYDGSDLKYSYNEKPYSGINAGQTGSWSTPKTIFTGGGEYCAIKVDVNGGIHIAAQDSSNLDLKYAYLSKYNASYSESNSVTVDAYAIVGTQIQIDTETETVGTNNTKVIIPYISYYHGSMKKPKMAYLVPQETMDYTAAGADPSTESLTGKWEVTFVPTSSDVQDDHMNIGLWKTKAGDKRANVQSGTDSVVSGTGYSYGNGTANPVVGYATVVGTQGYIETAQMQ